MNLRRPANQEHKALKSKTFPVDYSSYPVTVAPTKIEVPAAEIKNEARYQAWRTTNIFQQKQPGFYGVYIKVQTGDIKTDKARLLASIVEKFAADDIRNKLINQKLVTEIRKGRILAEYFCSPSTK